MKTEKKKVQHRRSKIKGASSITTKIQVVELESHDESKEAE